MRIFKVVMVLIIVLIVMCSVGCRSSVDIVTEANKAFESNEVTAYFELMNELKEKDMEAYAGITEEHKALIADEIEVFTSIEDYEGVRAYVNQVENDYPGYVNQDFLVTVNEVPKSPEFLLEIKGFNERKLLVVSDSLTFIRYDEKLLKGNELVLKSGSHEVEAYCISKYGVVSDTVGKTFEVGGDLFSQRLTTYYKSNHGYDRYIYMVIPKDQEGYYHIEDIVFSPSNYESIIDGQNGNKFVLWDSRKSPAEEYSITFTLLSEGVKGVDASELSIYKGDDPEVLKYMESTPHVDLEAESTNRVFDEVFNGDESIEEIVLKAAEWGMDHVKNSTNIRSEDAAIVFDSKLGACGARASTMVALLRKSGVPARTVSGLTTMGKSYYTSGKWDRTFGTHVWVEAYFEPYGWIMLEPGYSGYGINFMEKETENWVVLNTHLNSIVDAFWAHLPLTGNSLTNPHQKDEYYIETDEPEYIYKNVE